MTDEPFNLPSPLGSFGEDDDILPVGSLGAVTAPPGVGKTALLVQVALSAMSRGRSVLHVSLQDPVPKVDLWYREMFRRFCQNYSRSQIERLWEDIQSHRFIMTFRVDGFSVPRLEERVNDLMVQGIFTPKIILIDALPREGTMEPMLLGLEAAAKKRRQRIWIAFHDGGIPAAGAGPSVFGEDLLSPLRVLLQLEPRGEEIVLRALRGLPAHAKGKELLLDASSMLVREKS